MAAPRGRRTRPVIPSEEDGGAIPIRTTHHSVDQASHVGLPRSDRGWRMIAHLLAGYYPRNARQRAIQGLGREVGDRADVAELTVLLYGVEPGEGIPNLRRLGA